MRKRMTVMMTPATIYWNTHPAPLFTPHSSPIKQILLSFPFYEGGNEDLSRLSNMLKVAESGSKPTCAGRWSLCSDHGWPPAPCLHQESQALGRGVHMIHLEGLCYTHSDTASMQSSVILTQFSSWCLHSLLLARVQNWIPVKFPHDSSLGFCISNVGYHSAVLNSPSLLHTCLNNILVQFHKFLSNPFSDEQFWFK